MAPTKDAPIVRFDPETGERRLEVARWGLVPFFTKDLTKARKPINARSETVARSPLFKEAFARRRCLVPAAAYYEWRHDPSGKTPFAIARNDGEPVALGGMWEVWRSGGETLQTFATLTTDANPPLSLIQERMPVIIERTDWPGLALLALLAHAVLSSWSGVRVRPRRRRLVPASAATRRSGSCTTCDRLG
jgi:putative SOS response-associated peptidase YedK